MRGRLHDKKSMKTNFLPMLKNLDFSVFYWKAYKIDRIQMRFDRLDFPPQKKKREV